MHHDTVFPDITTRCIFPQDLLGGNKEEYSVSSVQYFAFACFSQSDHQALFTAINILKLL